MQKLKNICIYSEETKQSSEPDSYVKKKLQLLNRKVKMSMINMLRAIIEKYKM